MSESAREALAWRSAAAASSVGTRRNSRPDASQIQASSISKGFSSSCTLCRLRARRGARGQRLSAHSRMRASAALRARTRGRQDGRCAAMVALLRPKCMATQQHSAWWLRDVHARVSFQLHAPSARGRRRRWCAHLCDLVDALLAAELAQLQALDLGLGRLPAFAHGRAEVALHAGTLSAPGVAAVRPLQKRFATAAATRTHRRLSQLCLSTARAHACLQHCPWRFNHAAQPLVRQPQQRAAEQRLGPHMPRAGRLYQVQLRAIVIVHGQQRRCAVWSAGTATPAFPDMHK